MGVENSDSSIDVHEWLEYRLGKRALEAFINNIDKDTWDGIKDELSWIAKTFSNYNNFIWFTKFVTKTYEDISLLNSIHSKYGKETPLRSLLAEYWSKSKPGRFWSINWETLSKMVLQAEWKDNPTSRRIRKRRESRRQNIIEPQEIFSINLTENDISDQSVMNEKVWSAVVTFFWLEQENDDENCVRIFRDDSFDQQDLSENPIINSESPGSVWSVSLDFTVLWDLSWNDVAQQGISQLDDVKINSEDVIHFNWTPEQVEKWNHDLDVYFSEIDNKYWNTSVWKKLSERFYQMNLRNIELIVNSWGSINEVKSLFERWK